MIGIFIIIALAGVHYSLAKRFKKPRKWMYPILALFIFFASGFVGTTLLLAISVYFGSDVFLKLSETFPSLIAIPMGVFGVACSHYYLRHRWTKQKNESKKNDALLDDSTD